MDANTKEILTLYLPVLTTLVTGIALPLILKKMADVNAKQARLTEKVDEVKHATDGLTEKLVGAAAEKAGLLATAAEKVAQEDRETQQAKGAAAARQADAGAKVTTPLAMAAPSPTPKPEIPPGSIAP